MPLVITLPRQGLLASDEVLTIYDHVGVNPIPLKTTNNSILICARSVSFGMLGTSISSLKSSTTFHLTQKVTPPSFLIVHVSRPEYTQNTKQQNRKKDNRTASPIPTPTFRRTAASYHKGDHSPSLEGPPLRATFRLMEESNWVSRLLNIPSRVPCVFGPRGPWGGE